MGRSLLVFTEAHSHGEDRQRSKQEITTGKGTPRPPVLGKLPRQTMATAEAGARGFRLLFLSPLPLSSSFSAYLLILVFAFVPTQIILITTLYY